MKEGGVVDFEPVGQRRVEKSFVIGEVLQIGHGAGGGASAKDRHEADAEFVEVGAKLLERFVVVIEQTDFALDQTGRGFDVVGHKKNQLLPSQRPVHHPLPVTREPLLSDRTDILIGGLSGLSVIAGQFLPVVGIAGPLKLGALPWAESGEKDAELVLELITQRDRGTL